MIFKKKDNKKAFILGLNVPKVTAYIYTKVFINQIKVGKAQAILSPNHYI